jgi:hypothetical protein
MQMGQDSGDSSCAVRPTLQPHTTSAKILGERTVDERIRPRDLLLQMAIERSVALELALLFQLEICGERAKHQLNRRYEYNESH